MTAPSAEQQAAALMEAASAALGLTIAAEHKAGVAANLARLLALGEQVMQAPLPDQTEAAPVFRP